MFIQFLLEVQNKSYIHENLFLQGEQQASYWKYYFNVGLVYIKELKTN
jgi:hypothetical protein